MFSKEKIFIKSFLCWLLFWSFLAFFLNFFISPFYANIANKKINCTSLNCLGNVKQANENGLLDKKTLTTLNLRVDSNGNLQQERPNNPKLKHIYLNSKNNLISYKLSLYYYDENKSSGNWLIFVHGISSDWTTSFLYSQFAYEKKYNVVFFDSFGVDKNLKDSFGNLGSGGFGYPTFGLYEQYDINTIVNWIYTHYSNPKIGLFGLSMGAATSLIYLKNFYQKSNYRIKFLYADASYENTVNEMIYVLKKIFPLPWFFVIPGGALYMKLFFSYSPYEVNPGNFKNYELPYISFIHGTKDTFVPFDNFNKLFKEYWNNHRQWNNNLLKYSSFLEYGADHGTDLEWNKKNNKKFFNFLKSSSEDFFNLGKK